MDCYLDSQPVRSSQIVWVDARFVRAQLDHTGVAACHPVDRCIVGSMKVSGDVHMTAELDIVIARVF